MFNFSMKSNEINSNIDLKKIPKHIAIIMDGNGRWAKSRKLPRTMGHKAGVETIREIVKECSNLGVKYLTLYAFSTENWKRPKEEVSALMKLLVQYLRKEFDELNRNNVIINSIGDISKLPEICKKELILAYEKTKNNTGLVLNLALNYGGRDEIINAVIKLVEDIESKNILKEDINEEVFSKYLYTTGIPDPDLIIRPSGEQRLSNFLLWQCAYSEFWYSDIKWPDFKKEDLHKAIYDYQYRDRRFGGIK
ncbi:ditrans,polycis-undecaprenyl-diphosphate synthase [Clostridium acetireducens DSM 10703]|jgi:undecaprenyl diphosphate synthase|uniref:Isoprenyl transferase n=1 Tax=Clostridium acetireducens DSM 10703 TaxID=1121290 RepID=A0A1E8F236_9CLOT|nr:isoprenyl transferase [Clostridium acetireducens]OFI07720.1 ditrans,polycis-undecaprenyl-diphosphate synthase [Clostridium acetireducens DSM 10703]